MLIYIDNLSTETTEADLHTVFEVFGKVETTKVIRNGFSGESKGFGFVDMPAKAEAKTAIRFLNGTELKGKALVIK
jgi:RNA recognition motif-containing protein